jgi:[ribosomal protein S5]-alanine N-acetyltransferase
MATQSLTGERSTEAGPELVSLQPIAPRHAPVLFPLLKDWEVVRMLAEVPWPVSLADIETFIARQGSLGEAEICAIFIGERPVGCAGIKYPGSGTPPRKMPRLGYWIGRRHWGRGYATNAVGTLIARAFTRFPHESVGAGVFFDNPRSLRVLERLGFEKAGEYRTPCRARREEVLCLDMHLPRSRWKEYSGASP